MSYNKYKNSIWRGGIKSVLNIYGIKTCALLQGTIYITIVDTINKKIIRSKLPIIWLHEEKINNINIKISTQTEETKKYNFNMAKYRSQYY